jgi:hypothetical protein
MVKLFLHGAYGRWTLCLHIFFIICVEGLSSLLNKAEVNGRIMGFPITRGGTRVNHLFFADDSLLFYKANIFEWMHIITT